MCLTDPFRRKKISDNDPDNLPEPIRTFEPGEEERVMANNTFPSDEGLDEYYRRKGDGTENA